MSKLLRNGIPRTEDGKIDFSWKNHYGFTGVIVILGFLFPPLAVAVRFGIGKDFFINVLLTLCGIIPGHLHNWFIQNVRNNDTKARTPKWAIRYGLVDDRPAKKLLKKREWTGRYNDRLPPSQRMVYDDEGNAHVVDQVEEVGAADGTTTTTAPWNVHAVGGVKEQKTGLVEPDRWINEDPSQPKIDYANHGTSKPSKLGRFKRSSSSSNKAAPLPSTAEQGWVHDRHRRSSIASTASSSTSGGAVTPEDPTRTFAPSSHSTRNRKERTEENATPRRTEDDIFSHEF